MFPKASRSGSLPNFCVNDGILQIIFRVALQPLVGRELMPEYGELTHQRLLNMTKPSLRHGMKTSTHSSYLYV